MTHRQERVPGKRTQLARMAAALCCIAVLCTVAGSFLSSSARAQPIPVSNPRPDGEAVLARVDAHSAVTTVKGKATLEISRDNESPDVLTIELQRRAKDAFVEVIEAEAAKGSKIAWLDHEALSYDPKEKQVIRITGLLLRESAFGSSFSYEDLLGLDRLAERYTAQVVAEETADGRGTWVLDLTSREFDVAYPKRRIWVDKETSTLVRDRRFLRNGQLLKDIRYSEFKADGDRRYPARIDMEAVGPPGRRTVLTWLELTFGGEVRDEVFSRDYMLR